MLQVRFLGDLAGDVEIRKASFSVYSRISKPRKFKKKSGKQR
jgi:hypothetical protein